MRKGKLVFTIGTALMVVLVAVLPLLQGCTPSDAGKAGKVLKVGMLTPSTGVAAEKGAPGGHGIQDAVQYINTELKGVEGYEFKLLWFDTAYDSAKVVTLVKNLMDEGALMFTTHASAEMTAAKAIANQAEFPGLATYTAPNLYRPPAHIYGQMPDYGDDWAAFANYYMKNIWKGSGRPKMALHLLNNPTGYGSRDAARALADRMGIDIVATEEHTATTSSEIESLTRIQAKNPDVMFISSTPAPTAVIMKNAKALGLYPKIPVAAAHASFTKALIDIAGADTVEGLYGIFPTVTWDDNVPGVVKATEYVKKNNAKDFGNLDYISTWSTTLVVAEILRLAVKNAGYEVLAKGNVDSWRAVETQGIQKLKDYKVDGIHGPVSYTPGDNRLDKFIKIYNIKGGKIVPVSDWIEAPVIKYEEFPWWK
ncbi:MAG: ABC transporter substrate-binding protein [Chloroflexi bacterium]|nr:ABC transporter substrate-binding protein [Chloroflexota bacterium]